MTTPGGSHVLRSTLVIPTRRPDLKPTTTWPAAIGDAAAPATAEPSEAAVDGP